MAIRLEYIDLSEDSVDTDVVIFQKNTATGFDNLAVAWKVIRHCGRGNRHPIVYPDRSDVATSDSHGNYMPRLTAWPGQLFHVRQQPSGNMLYYKGEGTCRDEIQVQNDLCHGLIQACIFKDYRMIARKTRVAPGQKAVFCLKPVLYLAAANGINEGDTLNAAVLSANPTEISLYGVSSAQLVMTGGGAGRDTEKYTFSLHEICSD